MFDIEYISIIGGTITTLSLLYGVYRYISSSFNRLQDRIESIELSLQSKKRYVLISNCFGKVSATKLILLKEGMEFILDEVLDTGMARGKVFHGEVEVLIDLKYLREIG